MLNNIIVDKLRIAIPKSDIVYSIAEKYKREKNDYTYKMSDKEIRRALKLLKEKIDAELERHLIKFACVTSYRHSYFRIEFNPTRYRSTDWNDDVNLQMVPEEIFLRLFKAIESINPIIIKNANVVELNLTRNILLEEKTSKYIDMLLNIKTAYGVHPVSISSEGSKSVYFSSLKRDFREDDYVGNRLIKFYDKTFELEHVKGKDITNIKLREELTKPEKEKLGFRYSEKNNTINLDGSNLLRVELTYKHCQQLSKVAKFIGGEEKTKLSVGLLIDLLNKNELYKYFDGFFEKELKTFIFNEPIEEAIELQQEQEQKKTREQKYTQILPLLKLGKTLNIESEVYYFANLLETAGLNKNTITGKLKKINSGVIENELYIELYKTLFLDESVIPNKVNFDLYRQLIKIDKKNKADGIILSDDIEMLDEDEFLEYIAEGQIS